MKLFLRSACVALALTLTPAILQAGECPAGCEKACCPTDAQDAKLTKVAFQVNGLACADCEEKVTASLSGLKGVSKASACSTSKEVTVGYNAKTLKDKQLIAAIQKAGFKVDAEIVEINVSGMTCEACSGKVSKALAGLQGVETEEVCHISKKAVVKFDPNKVSREQLVATIDKTGFQAAK